MGRVAGLEEALKQHRKVVPSSGGAGRYFRLVDDGDMAIVRFLLESIQDIETITYHEYKTMGDNGRPRYQRISCLETDMCPLCVAAARDPRGAVTPAKISSFLPLYNYEDEASQIWTRSVPATEEIAELLQRAHPIYSRRYSIKRKGAKGDIKTRYPIFEEDTDMTVKLSEFPPAPETYGRNGIVWERTEAELLDLLQGGGHIAPPRTETRRGGADIF